MSDIETKRNYDEEEVSLLDLLAVIVRYRKLIVFGTLIVTFIAGLWLFVVPKVLPDLNKDKAEVTYTVNTITFPRKISQNLPDSGMTPLKLSTQEMSRLSFLVKVFKQYPVFYEDRMTDFEFNKVVQDLKEKKNYQVNPLTLGTGFEIKMNIDLNDLDDATEMVNEMVAEVEKNLQDYYMPVFDTMKENAELSLEKAMAYSTSTTDMSAIQELQDFAVELDKYTGSFTSFLSVSDAPFVVPASKGRAKKLVIAFIAAFFVFIIVAFCKNAIMNVKKDPEASKLIADAWKEGK